VARAGVEKLLERLLGVKGLRVRGARFEPCGVVVEVQPPRRKSRCGVCGRPLPALRLLPTASVETSGPGVPPFSSPGAVLVLTVRIRRIFAAVYSAPRHHPGRSATPRRVAGNFRYWRERAFVVVNCSWQRQGSPL